MARGRAACGSSCVCPRASRSLLGEGGRPRGFGGSRGLALLWPAGRGGEWGGEGRGDRAAVPLSPALGGGPWPPSLSPFISGAPPLGIHGLPGGRGRRARSGWPLVGQCGGGGERFSRHSLLPRLPQAGTKADRFVCAFLGAPVPLRPTAPAQSRRPAAGNAGVRGRLTGGA